MRYPIHSLKGCIYIFMYIYIYIYRAPHSPFPTKNQGTGSSPTCGIPKPWKPSKPKFSDCGEVGAAVHSRALRLKRLGFKVHVPVYCIRGPERGVPAMVAVGPHMHSSHT